MLNLRLVPFLCLLLFMLFVFSGSDSGCDGSSGDSDSGPWQSQGVTDTSFLSAVQMGSIYAVGVSTDSKAKIWSLANGTWSVVTTLDNNPSTAWTLLYKDGNLTVGYFDDYNAMTDTFDTSTNTTVSLGFSEGTINCMRWWDGNLMVAGTNGTRSGKLWRYNGLWFDISNRTSIVTYEAMAVNENDLLFVGGLNATNQSLSSAYTTVLTYNGTAWTDLQPSFKVPYLWTMISDGSDGVYAAGENASLDGQVWQIKPDGNWTDLGLTGAISAKGLRRNSTGTLFVCGQNKNFKGEVWRLHPNGTWDTMGVVGNSMILSDLGLQDDGSVVTVGMEDFTTGQVWIHK